MQIIHSCCWLTIRSKTCVAKREKTFYANHYKIVKNGICYREKLGKIIVIHHIQDFKSLRKILIDLVEINVSNYMIKRFICFMAIFQYIDQYIINILSRSLSNSLKTLDLSYNSLSSLPLSSLARLNTLTWLNLHG